MPRKNQNKRRRPSSFDCESLETRRLLTALVVTDTPAADTITLGVTATGGIKVIFNGAETDYKPNQWDSANVLNTQGADTINVEATVVPTVVHYLASGVSLNVGDASGVQNIKASLNMNGAGPGPVADGAAAISIDDSGDASGRTISMTTSGEQQTITGLAPAQISIGVVIPPLSPFPQAVSQESLTLTTGAGNDALTISSLRSNLALALYSAGGKDSINIGKGSLAKINSPVSFWGSYLPSSGGGQNSITLDDSSDASSAQFTITAIYPPGPGSIEYIDYQGAAIPTQRISLHVSEIASTTINGGSGGNKFLVQALPARSANDATLTLNTGGGNDSVIISATSPGTLVNVNGQGGDDSLIVGPLGPFAPSGVNGNITYDGGAAAADSLTAGTDSLTILGPQSNPLDIPTVPVIVTPGLVQHRDLTIHYADIATLTLEHGNYQINEDLGPINLVIASEKSDISFESSTDITFNASQNLQSLTISDGTVALAPGGLVLTVNGFNMTGGTLNLADGSVRVNYTGATPLPSIRSAIFSKQIFTGNADAHHTLGYGDGADHVVPNLPANTVLVTYARSGDANLDKTVGFADLVIVAQHYGQANKANWDQGDFNYDSAVGFADLVIVAQNYGQSLSPASAAVAAPAASAQVLSASASALLPTSTPATKSSVSKPLPPRPKRRR